MEIANGLSKVIQTACSQFKPEFGAAKNNIDKICTDVETANVDLLVFPELATSGYEFENRKELQSLAIDTESSDLLTQIKSASSATKTWIIFGFPERSGDKAFNSSALIEPDGGVHIYRKIHLFDREKNLFDPGDRPLEVIDTPIGRLGMMICFDWIFPEATRILAIKGAQLICHPSNLVLAFCQKAMFARSVENGVFTLTCNRIGTEARTDREMTFTGQSQILSNRGAVLAQAGEDSEEIIKAQFDPADANNKNLTPLNHILEDRRVGMYDVLV